MAHFPKGFLWGATLSAHQVEGGHFGSDWWRWEQRPGRIADAATSQVAAGHYERFASDAALAGKLGLNALLVGLAWARIQPEPTRFDEEALAHYDAVFAALHAHGIEPLIALQHVALPQWFAEQGGWRNPDAVAVFEAFAARVAARYAARCRWWIPFWEPMRAIENGYLARSWPPGQGGLRAAWCATKHMAEAHRAACRAIRRARDDAQIGLGVNAPYLRPLDPHSAWDLRTVHRRHWLAQVLPQLILHGDLVTRKPGTPRRPGALDFIGLGYEGAELWRFHALRPRALFGERVAGEDRSALPAPCASGLRAMAAAFAPYGLPLLLTGVGCAADNDEARCRFLLDHIAVAEQCLHHGVDIRGYFHRAFLDGFEWTAGYRLRYGLVHVDRETLARTPNPSAYLYKDIAAHGMIREGTSLRYCPGWRRPKEDALHAATVRD